MKYSKKQKSQIIKKLIEKWRPILFLGEWTISHKYVDNYGPKSEQVKDADAAAEIFVNYPYKLAHITTYNGFWEKDSDTQDSMLCHELCHCHTQELWDISTDFANGKYTTPDHVWKAVETLTQRISIIAKHGNK